MLASARRGRADAAGMDALNHASGALARAGFPDATLVLRWTEIAGPELARIVSPVKFQEGPEGGTLTLRCEAGSALFLQHQSRPLIEGLNSYLGAGRISRLRFVPGRIAPPPDVPAHPAAAQKAEPEPESPPGLNEALAALERRRRANPPSRGG